MADANAVFLLQPGKVQKLCAEIFEKAGALPRTASLVAENLVLADLRGISSHGISRVHCYCQRVRDGMLDPKAQPELVVENGAVAVVDARNGFGVAAGVKAMDWCVERARETGIASSAVRRSNHNGIAAFYALRAVPHDMIGIALTNAPPTMAPWGSISPIIGTNPFCYAIPAGKYRPVVLDCAASVVARGKINLAEIEGKNIPPGWAMDRRGRPTTDATEGLKGSVLPFGAYKGSGISIVIDVFCSLLSGAMFGSHIGQLYGNADIQQDLGHFFCALDISKFCSPGVFKERIDQMIEEIKGSEKAEGVSEIFLPGEIEYNNEERNRIKGIAVGPGVIGEIEALCRHYGIRRGPGDCVVA